MIKKVLDSFWIVPIFSTFFIISIFASVLLRLFPLPYYLSIALPFVLITHLIVIIYNLFKNRKTAVKMIFLTLLPLALVYLLSIQSV